MLTENSVDEQYAMICAEILEPTLKKIALSFSVSATEFYDTVHELSFTAERLMSDQAVGLGIDLDFDDTQGYDRILETVKSKQRLYRIAKRLTFTPDKNRNTLNSDLLSEPKIYDHRIHTAMIASYSAVSDMIGDSLFNKLDAAQMARALQAEGRTDLKEKRICFSFSEFAMFTCLYMALNRASLDALNSPIEKETQKKRLKGRMKKIKYWLFSVELHDALVRTLLDLFVNFNEEKYALLIDKHLRDFWLPAEKRHIKYFDYAEKKGYFLTSPWTKHNGEEENVELTSFKTDSQFMQNFTIENIQVQVYQQFFYELLPVIAMISEGIVPKGLIQPGTEEGPIALKPYLLKSNKIDRISKKHIEKQRDTVYVISPCEYLLAEKASNVLETYIAAVIRSVVSFLECLPEAEISGNKTFMEYLENI